MTDEARPATIEDLKRLLVALHDNAADYLLVGGYALAAHGYRRATTDIDLLVPATAEGGARLKQALLALPDRVAEQIDPGWFTEGENIRVADAFVVDLLLSANGHSYDALLAHEQRLDLDGVPVRTVDLEGLLLTKQTPREQDVADRLVIERALTALRGDSGSGAP